jgi:hypothetical protein
MEMSFLVDEWLITDIQKLEERRRAYKSYLQSVQNSLPPRVFEFAAAPWHYDHMIIAVPTMVGWSRLQLEKLLRVIAGSIDVLRQSFCYLGLSTMGTCA